MLLMASRRVRLRSFRRPPSLLRQHLQPELRLLNDVPRRNREPNMIRTSLASLLALLLTSTAAFADWDGYDAETGEAVTIEAGTLVREGRDIEIYDSADAAYHDVEVLDMRGIGSSVEIRVFDSETGEERSFEMERD